MTSLEICSLKEELGRIHGFLQVIVNRVENSEDGSDSVAKFLDVAKSYLKDCFYHEIDTVTKLYSEDLVVCNCELTNHLYFQ